MLKSFYEHPGRVQESIQHKGVTSVTIPPNPDAYKDPPKDDVYVEFWVLCSRVLKVPGGWGKIYGPNSMFGKKLGITEMPNAFGIQVIR